MGLMPWASNRTGLTSQEPSSRSTIIRWAWTLAGRSARVKVTHTSPSSRARPSGSEVTLLQQAFRPGQRRQTWEPHTLIRSGPRVGGLAGADTRPIAGIGLLTTRGGGKRSACAAGTGAAHGQHSAPGGHAMFGAMTFIGGFGRNICGAGGGTMPGTARGNIGRTGGGGAAWNAGQNGQAGHIIIGGTITGWTGRRTFWRLAFLQQQSAPQAHGSSLPQPQSLPQAQLALADLQHPLHTPLATALPTHMPQRGAGAALASQSS